MRRALHAASRYVVRIGSNNTAAAPACTAAIAFMPCPISSAADAAGDGSRHPPQHPLPRRTGTTSTSTPQWAPARRYSTGRRSPYKCSDCEDPPEAGANASENFVRALSEAGESGELQKVFDLIESRGQDIDEKGVEVALAQVAHCAQMLKLMNIEQLKSEVHSHCTFQTLMDMVARSAQRYSPEAKARMLGLLGQLRFGDQMVIDEIARSIMSGVSKLGPTHLSLMVGGLAATGHSPSVLLLDAVRDRVRDLGPQEVPAQQADRINEALRKLGHSGLEDGGPPNPPPGDQPARSQSGGADYA